MKRAVSIVATVALCAGLRPVALPAQGAMRLTLQEAITRAQEQGLPARAARASRDAARLRDHAFGSGLLPQFALTGNTPNYNRSIIPVVQPDGSTLYRPQEQNQNNANLRITQKLPIIGGDLIVNSSLSRLDREGTVSSRTWNSTPFSVGIVQPIFRPNTLKWDTEVQGLSAEIAERAYRESMEDVAIQAANAFFDYYNARLALQNAETNAAVNDTLYTLNNGRFQVGRIGENDLLQSELALLRAQVAVDGARLEHDRSLASLRLLLDLPLGAPLEIVVPTDIPEVAVDTAVAVSQALKNRATTVELQLAETSSRRRVAESRYGTGPGASLIASMGYNQTSPQFDSVYKDLRQAQTVNLSVSLPIFQWGARSSNIEAAKLDQERVGHTSRQTREQTAQEAHFAALQLAQTRRSLVIAAKADTVGQKRFDVAKNRYVIGRIGPDNLYQAQSEKDGAFNGYLQALRAYWVAYYRLRRVTMYDFVAGQAIR